MDGVWYVDFILATRMYKKQICGFDKLISLESIRLIPTAVLFSDRFTCTACILEKCH